MSNTPYGAMETPDGRFYIVNPGTEREERFRSVTAPLGRWDKDGLQPWAASLAARGAFEELPSLVVALGVEDCGRTYTPCKIEHEWNQTCPDCRCKKCEECLVRWMRDRHTAESHRRSDEGTRVHHWVSGWVATGRWLAIDPDIEVYAESFKAFVAEYGLTPQDWELFEARVLNRDHMYAGTLDALIHFYRGRTKATDDLLDRLTQDGQPRVQHALLLVDYKSREKPERAIFMDMPLQLAGYRFAQVVRLKSEQELPMPQVDGVAIVQIRPDKTTIDLLLAEEPEFAAFLSLLTADEWALERGKRAIGARTFSYAPSVTKLRAADSRRRRKEAEAVAVVNAPDPENPTAAETHAPVDDYTCSCGEKVDGFTAPEFAREKLYAKHITPVTGVRMPQVAQENTPAARGARAAAAARRGVHPVLAEMAEANGRPVVARHVDKHGLPARTVTVEAAVLGAPSHHGDDSEIPF